MMGTTWRIKDRSYQARFPMVMGILNATPDSFHDKSRVDTDASLRLAERYLAEGAAILDIGGASSRPGAHEVEADLELRRVIPVIDAIHKRFPDSLMSVDTYRADVARAAVENGASIVNDISAGTLDGKMLATVAALHVPYVMMHMQGTPRIMQQDPTYADVAAEVTYFLSTRVSAAHEAGIADVLVDPGFGFGKTTEQNFALLKAIPRLKSLGVPVLVGLSRKRMINEVLGTTPAAALNGTTVLNTIALLNGASVLRVHDVKEAVQAVALHHAYCV